MQSCPPYSLNLESLGEGNFIFVGSSTDEWAANVPSEWIVQVLDYCDGFDNSYLFQSKNPARFLEYLDHPLLSVRAELSKMNYFVRSYSRNSVVKELSG